MTDLRLTLRQDSAACAWLLQGWLDETPRMPEPLLPETEAWVAKTLSPTSQVRLAEAGEGVGDLALQGDEGLRDIQFHWKLRWGPQ